jgi:hypothetical protein
MVFTTADPTTAIFGLCKHKLGIFVFVGDNYSPITETKILVMLGVW